MSIDVSDLIDDPDFCEPFSIRKRAGEWVSGKFMPTITDVLIQGVVRPTNGDDLETLPEGDRVKGLKTFYCKQKIELVDPDSLSDQIIWQGNIYKVVTVLDWSRHGFYKAIASLVGSDSSVKTNP